MWTTFNAYQWDLDHSNPEVFVAMARAMLGLAAVGVDVLRLDAVPFLWKRLGTDCQNQPEVHDLLQAYRAVLRIAAPAVAFKAEAIVAPRDLVGYLGVGRHVGMECDLAYHNVLMVLLWSTLATRNVGLLTRTLQEMPPVPPGAGWLTYVRCHDDIGWAITDEDADRVGEDAAAHRRFLSRFYTGGVPRLLRPRRAPSSREPGGESRISGMAASLAGLEVALQRGDELDAELALRRLLVLYAVAFAHGGLPVIWMGDELALRNDRRLGGGSGAQRRQPLDAPSAHGLGPPRRAGPGGARRRAWPGPACAGSSRRAGRSARSTAPASHARCGRGDDHVFGLVREHAGDRLPARWPASASSGGPCRLALLDEHGVVLDARAAEPDGRPLRDRRRHARCWSRTSTSG